MAPTNEVVRARDEGYAEGRAETIRRLRAFTGVHPFSPDLDEPEHRAYPPYLEEVAGAHRVALERAADAKAQIQRLWDLIEDAEAEKRETLDQRREDRADKNPLAKLGGRVGDLALPVTQRIRELKKALTEKETWEARCLEDAQRFGDEAANVSRWIDDFTVDTDRARAAQLDREEAARIEAEHAGRDVSSRWCRVFRHEDFTAENEQRCGAITFNDGLRDVAGADFGYRWRRDVDDPNSGWGLHHILETNETILRYHPPTADSPVWLLGDVIESFDEAMDLFGSIEPRQGERNSVALVLDAYKAHRVAKHNQPAA